MEIHGVSRTCRNICLLTVCLLGLLSFKPVPTASAEKTVSQIFEEQGKAVIFVAYFGKGIGLGSGFFVKPDGVFVTNFHVVEGAAAVVIKLPDDRMFEVTGMVAVRPEDDLVVLKVEAEGLPVVSLGDSDTVKVGDRVIAIGNPLGLENTVSDGLVSAIREGIEPHYKGKVFQITAPISPGSSGGPVFNMNGEVVGITFLQVVEGQNLNFAIPINSVKPLLHGKATRLTPFALVRAEKDCLVIGNRVSKIYHVPGGQFYDRMRKSRNRVCFQSEEEAIIAGFRRSRR